MIEVIDCDLRGMAAALHPQRDMGLTFPLTVQEFGKLCGRGFYLFDLRWRQFHLPARVGDFHFPPIAMRARSTAALLSHSSLMSRRNFHVFAILRDRAPRDVDSLRLQQRSDLIVC